jgi:hypothetical protein
MTRRDDIAPCDGAKTSTYGSILMQQIIAAYRSMSTRDERTDLTEAAFIAASQIYGSPDQPTISALRPDIDRYIKMNAEEWRLPQAPSREPLIDFSNAFLSAVMALGRLTYNGIPGAMMVLQDHLMTLRKTDPEIPWINERRERRGGSRLLRKRT